MNEFRKFYLWGIHTKYHMGLYFAALVFLSGILTAFSGGDSLRLVVLLEMILVSFVTAVIQTWILPDSVDFSMGIFCKRSVLWLLLSVAITVAVCIWGGWFTGLPAWYPWLLGGFLLVGHSFVLLGSKFEQDADTLRLNEGLQKLQKKQ